MLVPRILETPIEAMPKTPDTKPSSPLLTRLDNGSYGLLSVFLVVLLG